MPITPDDPDADERGHGALTGYDLDVWEPPAPPPGLADSVLARMRAPLPPRERPRSARAISAATGATLVVAAAIAFAIVSHHQTAAPPVLPLVAAPDHAPDHAPGPRPAGTPEDDARVRALEKRVLELEVSLELLRAQVAQQHAPAPPPPPPPHAVPAPAPAPVVAGEIEDPFGAPHSHAPSTFSCDPFVHPHGCPQPCDAQALATAGIRALATASYSDALEQLDASLRCVPGDASVLRLAVFAACGAHDGSRARGFYHQLSTTEQDAIRPACVRDGIDVAATGVGDGTLKIDCTPPARIKIDDLDTGQLTPMTTTLVPGRHRVTFIIDGNRYTYPVEIRADETKLLKKDLR